MPEVDTNVVVVEVAYKRWIGTEEVISRNKFKIKRDKVRKLIDFMSSFLGDNEEVKETVSSIPA